MAALDLATNWRMTCPRHDGRWMWRPRLVAYSAHRVIARILRELARVCARGCGVCTCARAHEQQRGGDAGAPGCQRARLSSCHRTLAKVLLSNWRRNAFKSATLPRLGVKLKVRLRIFQRKQNRRRPRRRSGSMGASSRGSHSAQAGQVRSGQVRSGILLGRSP